MRVVTDLNPEADFSAYRTYQLTEEPPTEEIDRVVFDDIVVARIRQAIDSVLAGKGYSEAREAPDLLVSWHGGVDARAKYTGVGGRYGLPPYGSPYPGFGYPASGRVGAWDQGTVLIEVVDAKDGDLVWRGLGQTTLYAESDAAKRQALTSKSIAKIMQDFPPAKAP